MTVCELMTLLGEFAAGADVYLETPEFYLGLVAAECDEVGDVILRPTTDEED